jgi:hypothetical protein
MKLPTFWLALATSTAVLVASRDAAAFERQWHAGGGLGIRPTSISGTDANGIAPLLVGNLTYGLTDQFDVYAEVGLSRPSFGPDSSKIALNNITGDLGIVYTLDVLRVVPFGGLFAGVNHFTGASITLPTGETRTTDSATGLDLGVALGLRYQHDRSLAFGFDVRYHRPVLLPETTQSMGLFLSAAYTWGY